MARKAPDIVLLFSEERITFLESFHWRAENYPGGGENAQEHERLERRYSELFHLALWQARKSLPALRQLQALAAPNKDTEISLRNRITRLEQIAAKRAKKQALEATAPRKGWSVTKWLLQLVEP
jgi:hypothetical protein